MKKEFAVKSRYFSLVEAFKKEAEKMGWTYNESFNQWSSAEERLIKGYSNCLYFSLEWNGYVTGPRMSISTHIDSSKVYILPQDWDAAIAALFLPKEEIIVTIDEIAAWKGVSVDSIKIKK